MLLLPLLCSLVVIVFVSLIVVETTLVVDDYVAAAGARARRLVSRVRVRHSRDGICSYLCRRYLTRLYSTAEG